MVGGLAKWMLTLLWPGGAAIWAWTAAAPVDLLRQVVAWLATWPGAQVKVGAITVWTPIACWTMLIGLRVVLWLVRPAISPDGRPR
jgi:hypothetical protein